MSIASQLFILEANPRASRTIPFVSKAIGKPVAKLATQLMQGSSLTDINFTEELIPKYQAVKEAVLPFKRFPGTDALLGPEMRSTGEVMGLADNFGLAYAKSELAASISNLEGVSTSMSHVNINLRSVAFKSCV